MAKKSKKVRKRTAKEAPSADEHAEESAALAAQLAGAQLRIVEAEGDGNCLFRSLSLVLHGSQSHHGSLREEIVAFMAEHPGDFGEFVSDESFESHLARMRRDGVFGTQLELVAFTRRFGHTLVIHQVGQPPWVLLGNRPGESGPPRSLHLAFYPLGEHYDAVVSDSSASENSDAVAKKAAKSDRSARERKRRQKEQSRQRKLAKSAEDQNPPRVAGLEAALGELKIL